MGDVNRFGPLTPEQQAALDRDKIDESLGPFDFIPGMMTGIGAGMGAAAIPMVARDWPFLIKHYGRMRGGANVLSDIAKLMGGGAAAGYAVDVKNRIDDRHKQEKMLMFGNPADAEGQPGGFYGGPVNRLLELAGHGR